MQIIYLSLWKHQLYLYSDLSDGRKAEDRSYSRTLNKEAALDSYTFHERRTAGKTVVCHSNRKYLLNNR
jgi:hypothetical protein